VSTELYIINIPSAYKAYFYLLDFFRNKLSANVEVIKAVAKLCVKHAVLYKLQRPFSHF